MSASHASWALGHRLPCAEKFVLVLLADGGGCDEVRCFYPRRLATLAGLTEKRLMAVLARLHARNLISKLRPSGAPGELMLDLLGAPL